MKFADVLVLALASLGAAVPAPDSPPQPRATMRSLASKREPLWRLGDSPLPPARKRNPGDDRRSADPAWYNGEWKRDPGFDKRGPGADKRAPGADRRSAEPVAWYNGEWKHAPGADKRAPGDDRRSAEPEPWYNGERKRDAQDGHDAAVYHGYG
ncbi:hypothetical protein QBC34DRAFT_382796 [Podospora aff. communis PSN243]|uniref:Uncharacterized protein n=1 Tax=Podospora aff. communis PSN243 TaxID=3040156 RepID=A0AAV9GEX1_9PEZI|nr:hypothetical protein QBC34DRAFT_382796 [Podospora aff. communis PSN243]